MNTSVGIVSYSLFSDKNWLTQNVWYSSYSEFRRILIYAYILSQGNGGRHRVKMPAKNIWFKSERPMPGYK